MSSPIFLTFFAQSDTGEPLPSLQDENNELSRIFSGFDTVELVSQAQADMTDFKAYIAQEKMGRTVLFHFSGHTGANNIQTASGPINPIAIAKYFKIYLKNLRVVFLNGCANIDQVNNYLAAGAKVVIATECPVQDKTAKEFSIAFYETLCNEKTIRVAYETAIAKISEPVGKNFDSTIITRGALETGQGRGCNWALIVDKEHQEVIDNPVWWQLEMPKPIPVTHANELTNKMFGRDTADKTVGWLMVACVLIGIAAIIKFMFFDKDTEFSIIGIVSVIAGAFGYQNQRLNRVKELVMK